MLALRIFLGWLALASCSDNGKNYKCDDTILTNDNLCIFVADGDALAANEVMAPSVVDRTVGDIYSRKVVDKDGKQQPLGMKPWENLVGEAAATADSITGSEWYYLLSYELLAPLRNAMMFDPASVTTNAAEWEKLTKVMVDCHIKETTVAYTPFDMYSTDDILGVLQNPQQFAVGPSPHNPILQYLEEASADLWCAMTGVNIDSTHCDPVWDALGTADAVSDCWEAAYDGLYGAGAAALATGSDDDDQVTDDPTHAPTETPTPAPTAPAPPRPAPTTPAPTAPAPISDCIDNKLPKSWSKGGKYTCDWYNGHGGQAYCAHNDIKQSCCFCGGGSSTPAPPPPPPPGACVNGDLPAAWTGGGIYDCHYYGELDIAYCGHDAIKDNCCFCADYDSSLLQGDLPEPLGGARHTKFMGKGVRLMQDHTEPMLWDDEADAPRESNEEL